MILKLGQIKVVGDLFTSQELLRIYDPTSGRTTTANGLARELRRAGFLMVNGGAPIRTEKGIHRYFIVRNEAKWLKATPAAAAKHINSLK